MQGIIIKISEINNRKKQAQHRAAAETATRKLIGHFKRSMYDFFTGIIIVRYGEKVTELLLTVKNGYCQSW